MLPKSGYINRFGRRVTGIKGKPQPGAKGGSSYRRDRKTMIIGPLGCLGLVPDAPVHRGPAPMPWRDGPSKIRDKTTGLLIDTPALPTESRTAGDQRMRTTRYFRVEALKIAARTDLKPRDRDRMLAMVRESCRLFMEATRRGVDLKTGKAAKPRRLAAPKRRLDDPSSRQWSPTRGT